MDIRKTLDIQKDQRVNKIKPGHGPCCTCQDCGYHHDSCVCHENMYIEVCEYVEKLQADNEKLQAKIDWALKELAHVEMNPTEKRVYQALTQK